MFLLVYTINLWKKVLTVQHQKLNADQPMVVFHNLKVKLMLMRSAIFNFLPNSGITISWKLKLTSYFV